MKAFREMIDGGPVDVVTGDYLAELTMLILWKAKAKDPAAGYAKTFLHRHETYSVTVPSGGSKWWSMRVDSIRRDSRARSRNSLPNSGSPFGVLHRR